MSRVEKIHQAVDDEEWQRFRQSLKGTSTEDKLSRLREYWTTSGPGPDEQHVFGSDHGGGDCIICIRVDNYIKALCRGGQLYPGASLIEAMKSDFKLRIKRN